VGKVARRARFVHLRPPDLRIRSNRRYVLPYFGEWWSMFRAAFAIARQFTLPVVMSRKTVGGKCSTSIGSCVVINDEGWVATCFHITDAIEKMMLECTSVRALRAQVDAIKNDASLSAKQRSKQLSAVPKITNEMTEECSVWWGVNDVNLVSSQGIEAADFAVGKLEPFDPSWISGYPIFKDPNKDFDPGTSLCKLGFPFHQIEATWDPTARQFNLPAGAIPMPLFPIEGIFTRTAELVVPGAPPSPFPLRWVETSSPGLKGQSGGPTFDKNGWIWAIQARVLPIPLGFDGVVEVKKAKQNVPQFLNVGLGVHPTTIMGLLDLMNVKYQVSHQ
jgi:hypothetical protein